MRFHKKKISEKGAASFFIYKVTETIRDDWDMISKGLKDEFKDKFVFKNEQIAPFNFIFAVIAQEIQALENLFPKEKAHRIRNLILSIIAKEPEYGNYAVKEILQYEKAFKNSVQAGDIPIYGVAARLLLQWLSKNAKIFETDKNNVVTFHVIPFISIYLVAYTGGWKRIKDNFKIIKSELLE